MIPICIVSIVISASIRTTKGGLVRTVEGRLEKRSLCSLIGVKKKKKKKADIFTPPSMKKSTRSKFPAELIRLGFGHEIR